MPFAEIFKGLALAQIQSQNITAETKSDDPYVRRARPTFLYVIIAAMAYSLIVAPVKHYAVDPMSLRCRAALGPSPLTALATPGLEIR